ncbi:MAG TPA: polyphosphate kinase 2 family protein [Vicinamibacterales bacterium]|nr:polyphosphate kinase 2 family protein [Vicinamibacterales bacterium]
MADSTESTIKTEKKRIRLDKKEEDRRIRRLLKHVIARPGKKIRLKDHDPSWTGTIRDEKQASGLLADGIGRLAKLQDVLYAQDKRSVLLVFQAMDAAGKDGTIRHVMSGINPQGCQVYSFKAPSAEERDHTYLWRSMKALPERGRFGIHNRSYYEEVLVTRVHPELLAAQQLPAELKDKGIWKRRFREINNFERYLVDNGTVVLKFFLHVSKAEQKRRFLSRIEEENKNWKLSPSDAKERTFWDDYMRAYEEVFTHTSTEAAPWHIVPADNKWFTRLAVAAIIHHTLEGMDLAYPRMTDAKIEDLHEVRKVLLAEKD